MAKGPGFGSYKLGTSYGMRQGVTPPVGLNQAINWGAPQVELGGMAGDVGRTGRRVIKELAKANDIELTWHVPPDQNFELAYPDKKINSEAKRKLQVAMDYVKEIDAKLINIHPTQVINRPDENTVYAYDNHSNQMVPLKITEKIEKEAKKKGVSPVDYIIQQQDEFRKSQMRSSYTESNFVVQNYGESAKRLEPLAKSVEAAREHWNKLSTQGKQAIAATLKSNSIEIDPLAKELPEEAVKRMQLTYKVYKDRVEAAKRYAKAMEKEYGDFIVDNKPWISNGEEIMKQNFVDNFAPFAKQAVENKIKIGIENTDSRYIFGTPEEMNDIIDKMHKKLESMGLSKKQIKEYVGTTFDMGHATSMKGMVVRGKDGKKYTIKGGPEKSLKKFKNIIHIHAHENFGDMDAHLPHGEAYTDEQREEMEKYLKKIGYKGKMIHEVGSLGGTSYAVSLQTLSPGMYEVGGQHTMAMLGPSYQMASPTDGLFFPGEQRENYFYGSWLGGHI